MAAFWTELLSRIARRQGASGDTFPVEVTNSFPAGTNSIGKVDVDSSVLPTGAATAAKQDVLAGLIGAKDDTAVTDYTLDASEISLLKGMLAQMQGDGEGDIPVTVDGVATAEGQDDIKDLIGALDDEAVTDPQLSASEIALLKGILAQLQGDGSGTLPVNVTGGVTIDGDTELAGAVVINDGTDPAKKLKISSEGAASVQLTGSIIEYNWFAGEERPEPAEPSRPAIGVEVDAETGDMVGLLWNGEDWGEV